MARSLTQQEAALQAILERLGPREGVGTLGPLPYNPLRDPYKQLGLSMGPAPVLTGNPLGKYAGKKIHSSLLGIASIDPIEFRYGSLSPHLEEGQYLYNRAGNPIGVEGKGKLDLLEGYHGLERGPYRGRTIPSGVNLIPGGEATSLRGIKSIGGTEGRIETLVSQLKAGFAGRMDESAAAILERNLMVPGGVQTGAVLSNLLEKGEPNLLKSRLDRDRLNQLKIADIDSSTLTKSRGAAFKELVDRAEKVSGKVPTTLREKFMRQGAAALYTPRGGNVIESLMNLDPIIEAKGGGKDRPLGIGTKIVAEGDLGRSNPLGSMQGQFAGSSGFKEWVTPTGSLETPEGATGAHKIQFEGEGYRGGEFRRQLGRQRDIEATLGSVAPEIGNRGKAQRAIVQTTPTLGKMKAGSKEATNLLGQLVRLYARSKSQETNPGTYKAIETFAAEGHSKKSPKWEELTSRIKKDEKEIADKAMKYLKKRGYSPRAGFTTPQTLALMALLAVGTVTGAAVFGGE